MRRLALLSLLCLCGFSSDYDEDVPPVAARYQWASGCGTTGGEAFGRPYTVTRAAAETYECAGVLQSAGAGTLAVGSSGAQVFGGFVQSALNTESAASWTDVGTPTVVSDNWTYFGKATGDTITDDDGAGDEGKQFANVTTGTMTGSWMASCYDGSGTLTAARLVIETDATGSNTCAVSSLNTTGVRSQCAATVTGSPTYVRGKILVGANAAATGSITAGSCNLTPTATLQPYAAAAGSPVTVPATVLSAVSPYSVADSLISVAVTGTPSGAWTGGGSRGLFSVGAYNVANALTANVTAAGTVTVRIFNSSNAVALWTSAAHGLTTGEATITVEYNTRTGMPRVLVNGASKSMTLTAGDISTAMVWPASFRFGDMGTAAYPFSGAIRETLLCRGPAENCR